MTRPTLPNTVKALAGYDAYNAAFDAKVDAILEQSDVASGQLSDEVLALFEVLDNLGWLVGHAYGLDTVGLNNMDTCESCVRPGPWLRRLVVTYLESA